MGLLDVADLCHISTKKIFTVVCEQGIAQALAASFPNCLKNSRFLIEMLQHTEKCTIIIQLAPSMVDSSDMPDEYSLFPVDKTRVMYIDNKNL